MKHLLTTVLLLSLAATGFAQTREIYTNAKFKELAKNQWFVPPGFMIAALGAGLSLINFSIDTIINPRLRSAPANAQRVRKAQKEAAA